ncbi:hypothetical protein TWF225_007364 [Orbilia oligospora]|uniref:Uncharacterized protein n=2 Tax=Orbilia oligospora TaxID=2813651 RepID=A0A7C8KJ84_ORBOL|nr:hypothetical protein TWF751_010416 [Orbilia oligospora]KAF3180195.1 hypothetical protein TWF225_007364 [Orbilia oligospora]KAF3249001.1 hypothetical protein TWF217_008980 [Orbilia oligospora]KAF3262111.1 hypothetical protein TWF128_002788 [Orbilia oligospora]KAF3262112.1 hypothetical protein TWF128_002788 [Orbilia oligospora]
MAWDHLSINRPHLAYIILGGFTSLFMLVSLFVKEKLYIGEATVATICGVIFGPYAANLFDPNSWGNVDQITLECSRIVLVVQCFAVGVELPKAYMTRHWKSVVYLLIPVMTFGWLVVSVFIWWLIKPLSWLDSLCIAACVTATDPVLASSVVGKGKFAKRIPKHLRDLLSAESGCNDGMAFPFIYLAIYLIHYRPHAGEVFYHWFVFTVLYECVFGAVFGCCVGYAGRRLIKWAEAKNIIDRESFLVFYFTLALFCAGAGSILGVDDLLVGFCAGVAFSNDGWFAHKTEESHVSNVIDLLLNLAYFVYFGSIIPWDLYNRPDWGLEPWRLVCISILVIFFRRIPIMVVLRPFIPDIKTFRESLFAGHFGPIGVGAIFVAILARSELATGNAATPLAVLPDPDSDFENLLLIEVIWPIVTFLVISSIIVHGSSIAVFTLGKRINRMTLTMSYTTQGPEESWVSRLPFLNRGQSMSIRKPEESDNEKLPGEGQFPPGALPPAGGIPGGFGGARKSSGRMSGSEAAPRRRNGLGRPKNHHGTSVSSERLPPPEAVKVHIPPEGNAYQEGDEILVENAEGDVVSQFRRLSDGRIEDTFDESKDTRAGRPGAALPHPAEIAEEFVHRNDPPRGRERRGSDAHRKRGTATAYQSGNDVIVEDEDGEVIKVIRTNTNTERRDTILGIPTGRRPSLQKIGSWLTGKSTVGETSDTRNREQNDETMSIRSNDEHGVHLHNPFHGGRMSRKEIVDHFQTIDPRYRSKIAEAHNIPQKLVAEADRLDDGESGTYSPGNANRSRSGTVTGPTDQVIEKAVASARLPDPGLALSKMQSTTSADHPENFEEETPAERRRREGALGLGGERSDNGGSSQHHPETEAERRRREAALSSTADEDDSEDDGTERQQPTRRGIRFAEQDRRGG